MVKKIYQEDLDEDNELPEALLHDAPRKRKILRLKKESSESAALRRENKIKRRNLRQSKSHPNWESN